MKMVTVEEAFKTGLIDEYYRPFIAGVCSIEGCVKTDKEGQPILDENNNPVHSDLLVSDTLSTYTCSNKRCPGLLAKICNNMLTKLGITGAGEVFCYKAVTSVSPYTHLSPLENCEMIYDSKIREQIKTVLKTPMSFRDAIRAMALPGLDKKALSVFDNINSFKHLRFELDRHNGLENWLLTKFSFAGNDYYNCLETLITFMPEIEKCDKLFTIKEQAKSIVKIAITGDILNLPKVLGKKKMTKDEYVSLLNKVCGNTCEFQMSAAYMSEVTLFVSDTDYKPGDPNMTDKYEKALIREKREGRAFLIKSDVLFYLVCKEVEKNNGGEKQT